MVQQIWASRVMEFITRRKCFVMDLREEEEFRKGHLPKAVNIQAEDVQKGKFSYPKEIPIVVYCKEGSQSIQVSRLLSMKGYYVFNLAGGYEAFLRNQREKSQE